MLYWMAGVTGIKSLSGLELVFVTDGATTASNTVPAHVIDLVFA
jgi:hypothetical protein